MTNVVKMPFKKGMGFGFLANGQAFLMSEVLYIKLDCNKPHNSMRVVDGQVAYMDGDAGPCIPVDLEIIVK